MYVKSLMPILLGLGAAHIVPFDYTLPILFDPVAQIKAGQDLHYQLTNARNATCQATLSFSNDTFLPISTRINPQTCAGDQIAVFTIPYSVPDGAAALEWQCSGTDGTSFNIFNISGGSGNLEKLAFDSGSSCLRTYCHENATHGQTNSSNTSCS